MEGVLAGGQKGLDRLSQPNSSRTLTTLNLILQGMEIVQTMNSDPGLAVGMCPSSEIQALQQKIFWHANVLSAGLVLTYVSS